MSTTEITFTDEYVKNVNFLVQACTLLEKYDTDARKEISEALDFIKDAPEGKEAAAKKARKAFNASAKDIEDYTKDIQSETIKYIYGLHPENKPNDPETVEKVRDLIRQVMNRVAEHETAWTLAYHNHANAVMG
jgi:hypothetical protein